MNSQPIPAALVGSEIVGKLGTTIYARNTSGPYSYTYQPRVDPDTPAQQTQRQTFGSAAQTWDWTPLPLWIREPWATYAANVPNISRTGILTYPTGFNRFVGVISFKSYLGVGFNYYAPTEFTLGRLSPPIYSHPPIGNYYTRVKVTFDTSDPWRTQSGGAFALFCSRPQPPTINYFTGPFRKAGYRPGDQGNPPAFGVFALPFAATPGSFIWMRVRAAENDNRLSPAIISRLWYI